MRYSLGCRRSGEQYPRLSHGARHCPITAPSPGVAGDTATLQAVLFAIFHLLIILSPRSEISQGGSPSVNSTKAASPLSRYFPGARHGHFRQKGLSQTDLNRDLTRICSVGLKTPPVSPILSENAILAKWSRLNIQLNTNLLNFRDLAEREAENDRVGVLMNGATELSNPRWQVPLQKVTRSNRILLVDDFEPCRQFVVELLAKDQNYRSWAKRPTDWKRFRRR